MFYYRVYGHVLESNAAIPELLPAPPGAVPNLQIELNPSPHRVSTLGYTLRLTSRYRLACGEPLARLYESPTAYLLHHTHVADFVVSKSVQHVGVYPCEGALPDEVRLYLLGPVLSFALELLGFPSLHASAVSVKGEGAAFVGTVRGGKSTLAASFLEAGYSLLTDDILPLRWRDDLIWANPGYPQMRMWPDEARRFVGGCEGLVRVLPMLPKRRVPLGVSGFGTFCDEPQPLVCLYLLERRDPSEWGAKIDITPVSARDVVIDLIRHSFAAPIVDPLGLQSQRLDFFVQMAQRIPVRRLSYPSGVEYLPQVREAILVELETLS